MVIWCDLTLISCAIFMVLINIVISIVIGSIFFVSSPASFLLSTDQHQIFLTFVCPLDQFQINIVLPEVVSNVCLCLTTIKLFNSLV